jgi:hypothetical protein
LISEPQCLKPIDTLRISSQEKAEALTEAGWIIDREFRRVFGWSASEQSSSDVEPNDN